MTSLARLKAEFPINWTTILVGWEGPGRFQSQVSIDELDSYGTERLSSGAAAAEEEIVAGLLSLNLREERHDVIKEYLERLSMLGGDDPARERKKWRLILLEEVLESLPKDAIGGLTELTDFWSSFDFPSDSPHEVQGRGNAITPFEYYQDSTLSRLVDAHHRWVQEERARIQSPSSPPSHSPM